MEFQEKGSAAKKHFQISLVKSIVRIIGCGFLFCGGYLYAALLFGVAEILGIYEEIA